MRLLGVLDFSLDCLHVLHNLATGSPRFSPFDDLLKDAHRRIRGALDYSQAIAAISWFSILAGGCGSILAGGYGLLPDGFTAAVDFGHRDT
jgi:hypothetical protein